VPRPVPPARRDPFVEILHGEEVPDPYRYLEDPDGAETRAFIEAENTVTEAFLSGVSSREAIRARLTELWDYPKRGLPQEHAGRYLQWRQQGLENQPVLYLLETPGTDGRVLLDPNRLSEDGTVAVTGISLNLDGTRMAYATSVGGSDWRTWHILDVESGLDLPDVLEWSKFTGAAWHPDGDGLYYGRLAQPESGEELSGETRDTRIVFHRLGTPQDSDTEVWSAPDEPEWLPEVDSSEDGRLMFISVVHGTSPENQLHVLDHTHPERGLQTVCPDFALAAAVIGNIGDTLIVLTDADAERQRVVAVELADPERAHWQELVAEQEDTLLDAHHVGGQLLCHYLHDVNSRLALYSIARTPLGEIPIPPGRHVGGISGRADSASVFYSTSGFVDSGSVSEFDLETQTTTVIHPPAAAIDPEDFITTQVFVDSTGGARVPVFLTHRRDVSPNSAVPTLLYGYGGFNIALTPHFSASMALFVERGGLLAYANLRGGGEYGRSWYDAGRLEHKQNVFDDFMACARALVDLGWTRPDRLAINGGSNGGLLVGACLVQHPEVFGAAIPEVGVLDLLRFHRFTIGWAWTSDYGDPDDPEQYKWVRAYSPLQNLREGVAYPATLIVTGDHDDRVVPAHSFKFAAALQHAQGGPAPILLRVETSAGHGMGKPTAKIIAERTDVLAFIEAALGVSASG
jgi:prolyl oligopeptidase